MRDPVLDAAANAWDMAAKMIELGMERERFIQIARGSAEDLRRLSGREDKLRDRLAHGLEEPE